MKKLFDNLPGGMVVFRAEAPSEIVYVNEAFAESLSYDSEALFMKEAQGRSRICEEDIPMARVAMEEARQRGNSGEYELRFKNRAGQYRWHVCRLHYVEEPAEGRLFVMTCWDIHERKQMEEELFVQMERYRLVETITGEIPFDYDVESGETLISSKYLRLRQMNDKLEHFAKRSELEHYIYIQDIGRFQIAMEQAGSRELQGSLEIRLDVSTNDEEEKYAWYRFIYKSIKGVNGKIVRVIGRMIDIDREKREQYQLSEQARKDALTGLLNKAATKTEVEEYLNKQPDGSHALLIVDIDNFKSINDTFGHLFGDTVLLNIAEKITGVVRKTDIVGRVGGDEFLVLLKEADKDSVANKARKLCDCLKQQYHGEREDVEISCSIGIAFFNQDGITYEELFRRADYAMYEAKNAGKNRYHFAENTGQEPDFGKREKGRRGRYAEPVQAQDESFLSAAFSLLAHSQDLNCSLNLLLERIGKRYKLDVVAVIEDLRETKEFMQTNCWRRSVGVVEDPVYRAGYDEWAAYTTGFDGSGILAVDDFETTKLAGMKLRSGKHLRAMVNCRFKNQNGRRGMVTYCKLEEPRTWTAYEKDTFLEISKIISVFVTLKASQREDKEAIRDLKRRDQLTGLLNERAFREAAREKLNAMDESLKYAMVYSDIRDFSYINETFGTEMADRMLRDYANSISSAPMVLSCRLYSDLFVTLIWDTDRETIFRMAESAVRRFAREQKRKHKLENVRVIAGIYYISDKNEDIGQAIENANLARKKIKQDTTGTACQVYTPEVREKREQEKKVIAEFEDTLKEERLKLYIQPKFMLESMELWGGEALVRWKRRDGSLASPNSFIPILEKSGLIVKLDFYILEQLLKYMKKWKEAGKELLTISVNFSRKHFDGKGIYSGIRRLTDKYGIEHKYIEVEITESILASGFGNVQSEVERLRKDGFAVAIDDFGTGYSSLSILRDIPADVIKMDKSFLDRNDIEADWEFIAKIGALIRSIKEEVVFEGVETSQQAEFLARCGFRYGQGFLFERPLDIDVFEEKYMK